MYRLALLFIILIIVTIVVAAIRPGNFNKQTADSTKAVVKSTKTSDLSKATRGEKEKLQQDLLDFLGSRGAVDNVSIFYRNLAKGYEISIAGDRSWVPASTVKAFVLVEAFRQKQLGLVNFDQRVIIKKENVVPTELEAVEYQPLRDGNRVTIRELVYAMTVQSDNTAFNALLDVLDRRNINNSLKKYGIVDTVIGEKLSLDDNQLAIDKEVEGRQENKTTASDLATLFTLIYQGKIPDSEEILTIFKQQKLKDMIPAMLPDDVVVAHKTGFWSPYFHDAGIVYKQNEPYVLVVMTNLDGPHTVAEISKICYFKSVKSIENNKVLGVKTFRQIEDFMSGALNKLSRK